MFHQFLMTTAKYSTTDRDGYREYKSAPKICANCPTRELCTHSKDCVKTVQRHVWKGCEEKAGDARYTPAYAQLYMRRKETIEWIFADAKEKHATRYTRYRGLTQVTNEVKLKFAAMNLKNWPHGSGMTTSASCFSAFPSLNMPETRLLHNAQPGFSTSCPQSRK